ncbi:hypothetical protein Hanom_Chr05g00469871 [Helianthus anomalus]
MMRKIVTLLLKNKNFKPFCKKRMNSTLKQEHIIRKIVNLSLKNINFKPFCKKRMNLTLKQEHMMRKIVKMVPKIIIFCKLRSETREIDGKKR